MLALFKKRTWKPGRREEEELTEKLDQLHPVQQLGEQSSSLVRPDHSFQPFLEQDLHDVGL